jgi:hypothetical protein
VAHRVVRIARPVDRPQPDLERQRRLASADWYVGPLRRLSDRRGSTRRRAVGARTRPLQPGRYAAVGSKPTVLVMTPCGHVTDRPRGVWQHGLDPMLLRPALAALEAAYTPNEVFAH